MFLYPVEMTYKSHSVETLGFLCKSAVDRGTVGWSFVSDSVQAHDYIMGTPLGRKLKEKGLCFVSVSTFDRFFCTKRFEGVVCDLEREFLATRAGPSPELLIFRIDLIYILSLSSGPAHDRRRGRAPLGRREG